MAVKQALLALLEARRGAYLSGEEAAGRLGVSRAAVWKAVRALRADGYAIDAATNRGYRLAPEADVLSAAGVQKYLGPACAALRLRVLEEAPSTNALLREEAAAGAPEGTALIAARQTAGRGRLGRSFYSPAGTGVYLSLLLRPAHLAPERAVRVTTMAAVAMCEAVEQVSGRAAAVKWVNDVFVGGKKVCGILTEGSFGMEDGRLEYLVLGVGMNAYEPAGGFPADIAGVAGAIYEAPQPDGKNRLAAAFLNRFMALWAAPEESAYAREYRRRSFVLGRRVTVLSREGTRSALALDVDEECRLVVRYDDGTLGRLSSGEISVRPEREEPV